MYALIARAKFSLRRTVREMLLSIIMGGSFVFAIFTNSDPHSTAVPLAFMLAIPVGLPLWIAYRILRFAIGR